MGGTERHVQRRRPHLGGGAQTRDRAGRTRLLRRLRRLVALARGVHVRPAGTQPAQAPELVDVVVAMECLVERGQPVQDDDVQREQEAG